MPLPAFDPWDDSHRSNAGGDPDASRARRRYRVWLWSLVAFGGVGLVCGGGVPLVMYLRVAAADREAMAAKQKYEAMEGRAMREAEEHEEMEREKRAWQATAPPGARWQYTRAEFESLVTGKTLEEVEAAVGRPSRGSGESGVWVATYRYRTINPATGRADPATVVRFETVVRFGVKPSVEFAYP